MIYKHSGSIVINLFLTHFISVNNQLGYMQHSGRKKSTKTYAMDGYLIERIAQLSDTGMYGSQSNIVSIAVAEFLARNESTITEQQRAELNSAIELYLKSSSGEAIIRDVIRKMLSTNVGDIEETEIVLE